MHLIELSSKPTLRIVIVHNAYQQRGGEDAVVEDEAHLLSQNGHAVHLYTRHNDEIHSSSVPLTVRDALWSPRTVHELTQRIDEFRPDLLHVHNTFPLISPSVYYVASRKQLSVVQTLHNFRFHCPQAMLLRDGRVCEDCLGRLPWPAILHRCYRGSFGQTAVVAGMLALHRSLGTFDGRISRYIALSRFSRDKFVEAGIPEQRISIKPNFVDVAPPDTDAPRVGALFVGRLSPEKGTKVLAEVAAMRPNASIDVIGTGPEEKALGTTPGIRLLGWQDPHALYSKLRKAAYLVMPSVWYETFGKTLIEAFACGTPVIASRLGAMAEIVRDGELGLLFEPGNSADLSEKMMWAERNPTRMRQMGEAARREYETRYTPQINIKLLIDIYRQTIASLKCA